ncbi:MAG: (d)CMP kinase [archaeon]
MIITITSYPGTETKELSKLLALQTGLRYFSANEIKKRIAVETNLPIEKIQEEDFTEKIKQIIEQEAKNNDIIIDHTLAAWIINNADLKVFLKAYKKTRAKKMSEKLKIPMGDSLEDIELKEKEQEKNFLNNYGINIYDLQVYDLMINTDKLDEESVIGIIKKYLEKMHKGQ